MKYLIQSLFVFSLLFTMQSCKDSSGSSISGKVSNAEDMSVFLDKISVGNTNEILFSKKADGSGKFKFDLPTGIDAGVYRLRFGAKSVELVVDGSEKHITIDGDLNTLQTLDYSVQGAPLTTEYMSIAKDYVNKTINIEELTQIAENEANPLTSFMIASRMFSFRDNFAPVHTVVSKRLKESYPDLYFVDDYISVASQLEKQLARKNAIAKIQVGMDAPDIKLPAPDGSEMSLSDLKGKVVLLDFWASWCRPCRAANPKVVEVYKKYKSKGFEVFSVSLDGLDNRTRARIGDNAMQLSTNMTTQKKRWIDAIAADNLIWNSHVSDLMKWDSKAAALYGVSSIPKTFLIGADGKIAAIDPRYNLEESLLKHLPG